MSAKARDDIQKGLAAYTSAINHFGIKDAKSFSEYFMQNQYVHD